MHFRRPTTYERHAKWIRQQKDVVESLHEWQRIYAWLPVRLTTSSSICVWLETVERRYPDAFLCERSSGYDSDYISKRYPEYRLPIIKG